MQFAKQSEFKWPTNGCGRKAKFVRATLEEFVHPDHSFNCPLCKEHIVYTSYMSVHIVILDSRPRCPSCQGELLIQGGTIPQSGTESRQESRVSASRKRSRK